jgi:hypothetical protein
MLSNPAKRTPLASLRQDDWDRAREAYFLDHTPGLREHHTAQERASVRLRMKRRPAIRTRH